MKKVLARLAGCLVAVWLPFASGCREQSATPPARPLVPAGDLAATDILPHTHGPITRGRNYVYCATFQIAWDEFRDKLLDGQPLQLSGSPPLADVLNQHRFTRKSIGSEDFLAIAGRVDDGVMDNIASEMQRRFPQSTLPLPDSPPAGGAAVFAYLFKWLPFETPFDRPGDPLWFQAPTGVVKVASFGIEERPRDRQKWAKMARQVQVLDYRTGDDFVLRLLTKSSDDQLVLAKVRPAETLAATIALVRARANGTDASSSDTNAAKAPFAEQETLEVPLVRLDVDRSFDELAGTSIENPGTINGLPVGHAQQAIRFVLDETGAKLESSARFTADSKDPVPIRRFIFNRPFLLLLARGSGATAPIGEPYFAMWIETPELLQAQ